LTFCAARKDCCMETTATVRATEDAAPPDYVYNLIQISILAQSGDVSVLVAEVEIARARGADNREILRAMFRSDDAFGAGVQSSEFVRIAETLQAGLTPALSLSHA